MLLPDIRNAMDSRTWLAIAAAACVVDTAGLFVWRYTATPTGPINTWYDRFGLAAYGADVLSMIIGLILAQLITSSMGGPWNPVLFIAIVVAIQLIHDIVFAGLIVPAVPRGRNAIMDLMRSYSTMSGAGGILVVDAIYMILTALIAMLLMSVKPGVGWITLIVTLYITMYILYTRPSA